MNTPHPSGKLARWGLAIQELDLHIHHRSGKTNQAADALSHQQKLDQDSNEKLKAEHPVVQAKDGEGGSVKLMLTIVILLIIPLTL